MQGQTSTQPPPPTLPTTFVQADAQTFRDVVQKLTGAAVGDHPDKLPVTAPARPSASTLGPRRPAFKLQERRQTLRKLEIKLARAPFQHPVVSPRSPQLARKSPPIPSPVTPLLSGALFSPAAAAAAEERAIAEKRFYLHPSPRSAGASPPELLPLFPLTSPRQSSGSESSSSERTLV